MTAYGDLAGMERTENDDPEGSDDDDIADDVRQRLESQYDMNQGSFNPSFGFDQYGNQAQRYGGSFENAAPWPGQLNSPQYVYAAGAEPPSMALDARAAAAELGAKRKYVHCLRCWKEWQIPDTECAACVHAKDAKSGRLVEVTDDKARMILKMLDKGRSKEDVADDAEMSVAELTAWQVHHNKLERQKAERREREELEKQLAKEAGTDVNQDYVDAASLDDGQEAINTCSTMGDLDHKSAAVVAAQQATANAFPGMMPPMFQMPPADLAAMGMLPMGGMPMPGMYPGWAGYYGGSPMGQGGPGGWPDPGGKGKSRGNKRTQEPRQRTQPKAENEKTTVMLRNLPNDWKAKHLLETLDSFGFKAKYDFVYLPKDFQRAGPSAGLGYAFVNLVSNEDAIAVKAKFDGFKDWKIVDSKKVCECAWGEPLQGLHEHVERYRDSPLMHPDVPKEYKPMLFVDGTEVEFPKPKKNLRKPRMKSGAKGDVPGMEQDGDDP